MSRQELYTKLQEISFVLYDLALFLDSHPHNQAALEFFHDNQALYDKYSREYQNSYGPMTIFDVDTTDGWTWTQGPWPWEVEE